MNLVLSKFFLCVRQIGSLQISCPTGFSGSILANDCFVLSMQGSRDANCEWENKRKGCLVQYSVTRCLHCSINLAIVASSRVLQKEEAHLDLLVWCCTVPQMLLIFERDYFVLFGTFHTSDGWWASWTVCNLTTFEWNFHFWEVLHIFRLRHIDITRIFHPGMLYNQKGEHISAAKFLWLHGALVAFQLLLPMLALGNDDPTKRSLRRCELEKGQISCYRLGIGTALWYTAYTEHWCRARKSYQEHCKHQRNILFCFCSSQRDARSHWPYFVT